MILLDGEQKPRVLGEAAESDRRILLRPAVAIMADGEQRRHERLNGEDGEAAFVLSALSNAQRRVALQRGVGALQEPNERGQLSPAAAWRALATTGLGNDVDGDGELNADEARGRRARAAITCVWCVRAVTR